MKPGVSRSSWTATTGAARGMYFCLCAMSLRLYRKKTSCQQIDKSGARPMTPLNTGVMRWISLSSLLFTFSLLAQNGAVVTQTMRIEIDKRIHTARKINGRWWSEDNRELSQTNVGWLWNVSGGNAWQLVRFDHHLPVDPAKVNNVDRSMGPEQVKAVLGPPNSVFPSDKPAAQQIWNYYGTGGYKLSIHFSSSGGIFDATVEPDAKSMPQDVRHLAFRFNGKTARESYEEQKKNRPQRQIPSSQEEFRKQLSEEMARRRSQGNQTSPR